MHKKKMNCTRKKAEALAAEFGVSTDIVNQFEYQKEQKTMENDSRYSETRIGKVLGREPEPENEPVMDCVKKKTLRLAVLPKIDCVV